MDIAVLAGGCFWGIEELLGKVPGVVSTTVGYCGGSTTHPLYRDVKTGETGHAEAIRIEFDPKVLAYDSLLDLFFRLHDPTQRNRQMNDVGTQYRSAIFYQSDEQRKIAEAKKSAVDASGKWKNPVVTEIVPATPFWDAEAEHQDYLARNPGGYTCHWLRD